MVKLVYGFEMSSLAAKLESNLNPLKIMRLCIIDLMKIMSVHEKTRYESGF